MRYAVAIAEEKSFTRAAERCFVVQSALSRQIKSLESELGVMVFARTSRRVTVTPAGEAFLAQARLCLAAAERAGADAAAAQGTVRGPLRVGGDTNSDGRGRRSDPGRLSSPVPGRESACPQWRQ